MVWETIQKIKERFKKKISKIQKQKSFERSLGKAKMYSHLHMFVKIEPKYFSHVTSVPYPNKPD
jgi:ribosomal protein S24E